MSPSPLSTLVLFVSTGKQDGQVGFDGRGEGEGGDAGTAEADDGTDEEEPKCHDEAVAVKSTSNADGE